MVDPDEAFAAFRQVGISFWTGVPDSLLKEFCRYVEEVVPVRSHVIAANEGGAVAIAAGYHLATGGVGGVYLQNSGLGNTINPLVSLADPAVYQIPMVLVIGWRGRPGTQDEPQHRRQGETTFQMLEAIGVPARVVSSVIEEFRGDVEWAAATARERRGPAALVVPAGTFSSYAGIAREGEQPMLPTREQAIIAVARALPLDAAIVATTGKTGRELYEYRKQAGETPRDFLTVGSMGHASQIALGIALARPDRRVCVFDGDGAVVMHLGSLAVIAEHAPPNLCHVVFNNRAHESVGGQATPTRLLRFPDLATAIGYRWAASIDTLEAIPAAIGQFWIDPCPSLLEIVVRQGSRSDLGRPQESPVENRDRFVHWLA